MASEQVIGIKSESVIVFTGISILVQIAKPFDATSLLARQLEGALTVENLAKCWGIMRDFRTRRAYFGDAKLANFLATDDGEIRVIDFETAGITGEADPSPMRTFLTVPNPDDPCLADRFHFLASILYPYEQDNRTSSTRYVDLRTWRERKPRTVCEAWAINELQRLI